MNREEMIINYCKANPEPIDELCPEIIQYWDAKDGRVYWSNRGLKRTYSKEDVGVTDRYDHRLHSVASEYTGFYIHYIPEFDAMEFSTITMNGGRGKDGEKKPWKFVYSRYSNRGERRFFAFRGDTGSYEFTDFAGQPHCHYSSDGRYYDKSLLNFIHNNLGTIIFYRDMCSEIRKFDPTYGEPRWGGVWAVEDWYKRQFVERKKSKETQSIEELELQPVEIADKSHSTIVFQRLNEKYGVLRYFHAKFTYNREERRYDEQGKLSETFRLYININGKCVGYENVNGKWSRRNGALPTYRFSTYYPNGYCAKYDIVLGVDEIYNFPPLKYIWQIVMDSDKKNCTIPFVASLLRHPIIEQLSKAGYPEVARSLCERNEVGANLKHMFGVEKEKKMPFMKLLGVNKYLLKAMEEGGCRWSLAKEAKILYGRDDVSDLSEETIDLIIPFLQTGTIWLLNNGCDYRWYRNRVERPYTEAERKLILKLCRLEKKHSGTIRYYKDILNINRHLTEKPDIDLTDFDDYGDLERIHESLLELQRIEDARRQELYALNEYERAERQKKEFEKRQEERVAKYNCTGDKFSIRVPNELTEITREGNVLRHCVGGYLERHAQGGTNILFLRKNDEPDVPFYTIEIQNGMVVQIHGMCNKWLGNDPEAIPFVYQWLTERGIEFDKKVLLNTGSGYGAGRVNLPDSYLTQIA